MISRRTLGFFLAIAVAGGGTAHELVTSRYTYHRDVYPIFEQKCGSCHRPAGVAPMSLLAYREAYPWAAAIKEEVLHLRMPPWYAEESGVPLRNEHRALTAEEMDCIVEWASGGTPEGSAVAVDAFADGDEGSPPADLSVFVEHRLDADTMEDVRYFVLAEAASEDRYLRGVAFRPGAPNAVRSAIVFAGTPSPDAPLSDPAAFLSDRVLAVWLPDEELLPQGEAARRLPAGTALLARVRYQKTWLDEGKEIRDRSRVDLHLQDREPEASIESWVIEPDLPHGSDGNGREVTAAGVLDREARLVAIFPQLGTPLERLRLDLLRADGSRLALLRLQRPRAEWPRRYWLDAPLVLEKGARVELLAVPEEGASGIVRVQLDLISG